mmetsp:Transcript_10996/g.16409  ORF Transcript_10996/g.16409 Transcript_10996/m.16409 type:complete len:425 (+) Transcript_10996:543-1817(+)
MLDAHFDGVVDLRFRGETADSKPDGRVRHFILYAERTENVRGLERGRRARRSRRDGNVLQRHEQALALDEREADVHVAREARLDGAIHRHVIHTREDPFPQPVPQPFHMGHVPLHFLLGDGAGGSKARDKRVRQRAAAQAALLPSAAEDRLQAHAWPAPHVERADPLRSVDLVGGDGHEVDVQVVDEDRHLADGLGGVDVEEHLPLAADLPDLRDRLDHADLVVRVHHGDERSLRRDRRLQRLQVHDAVGAHGQVGHLEALLLQPAARVEHTLVLRDCRDHVVLLRLVEARHPLDRHVVRLRRAGGEDDLLRVCADERGHLPAGGLHNVRRLPAVRVRLRVRVAVHACQVGEHCVERSRVERSRRLRVEIYRPALAVLPGDVEELIAERGRRSAKPARSARGQRVAAGQRLVEDQTRTHRKGNG